jgi:hypothetical protein
MEVGNQVILSELGRINFVQRGFNSNLLLPAGGTAREPLQDVVVYVFPEKLVVTPPAAQTIYVVVLDQYLQPVSSANVQLTMRFPLEGESVSVLHPTNGDGITLLEFPVTYEIPGRVEIIVTVSLPTHSEETHASFRIGLSDDFSD